MRKLLLLVAIIILQSCTWYDMAETTVQCPCRVTKIEWIKDGYRITINQMVDRDTYRTDKYIVFYTKKPHQLGDIIE